MNLNDITPERLMKGIEQVRSEMISGHMVHALEVLEDLKREAEFYFENLKQEEV